MVLLEMNLIYWVHSLISRWLQHCGSELLHNVFNDIKWQNTCCNPLNSTFIIYEYSTWEPKWESPAFFADSLLHMMMVTSLLQTLYHEPQQSPISAIDLVCTSYHGYRQCLLQIFYHAPWQSPVFAVLLSLHAMPITGVCWRPWTSSHGHYQSTADCSHWCLL